RPTPAAPTNTRGEGFPMPSAPPPCSASMPGWARALEARLLTGTPAPTDRFWAEPSRVLSEAGLPPDPWQPAVREAALTLELANGSRVVSLPGEEGTIRGYSGARLLVIDEAARVPDELYRTVRPMLAVSRGRLMALSSAFARMGWFDEAHSGSDNWERYKVP